ncbi:MAG: hypothetical protein RI996_580 [Candidatus Parcubacteria bacterium]|jgi:uncharacterized membrane protein
MKQNTILAIASVVAFLGLLDSIYLTYTRFMGIVPPCSISFFSGCATVAKSSYSVFFGIPLSLIGVFFYLLICVVTITLIYKKVRYGSLAFVFFSTLGGLFSLYFVYLQAFVIRAFCIYCVASAIASFVLVPLAFIYKRKDTR